MPNIIGLKELRENTGAYIAQIRKGRSFVVVRRSTPVFKISPPVEEDGLWEPIIDFTKIRKGGIPIRELMPRL